MVGKVAKPILPKKAFTMPSVDCIEKALENTGWNKARVRCLARFLMAIIACRTVCLYRLANVMPGAAKTSSHYKRLRRFVMGFPLDFATLARLVVRMAGMHPPFVLAMDRTNWKLGKAEINLLVLAIVYQGIAFPVVWKVLGKAGNSNLAERQEVLSGFMAIFGKGAIASVCADREFSGVAFLSWLRSVGIGFVVRLRGNVHMTNARGQLRTASALFRYRQVGVAAVLGRRLVFGKGVLPLFVAGQRAADGDDVIVVSDSEDAILERYGKRWGVETLFGCLKRRGFDLEATHLTSGERLCVLVGVLALAFSWAYVCGVWLFEQKPWKIKKHGRLMASLFRRGLDFLQRLLMPLCGNKDQQLFNKAIQFLYCT
jgi:hypothetical protein